MLTFLFLIILFYNTQIYPSSVVKPYLKSIVFITTQAKYPSKFHYILLHTTTTFIRANFAFICCSGLIAFQ